MRLGIVLTISALALAFATPAAAQHSPNEIKLIDQRAKLIGKVQYLRKAVGEAREERNRAWTERNQAKALAEEEHKKVDTLKTRNVQLEAAIGGSLPATIEAVAVPNFREQVFRPAFNAYPIECRDFVSAGGSWSYTFYSPNLC